MAYSSTPLHGKVARVEKNDVAVNFTDGWEWDASLDMADASYQGQHWKKALPGLAGATGRMTGHWVAGNTEQKALFDNIVTATPGTKLTDVKFLVTGTAEGFSGDIYITGFALRAPLGDTIKFTIPFQLDGEPTYSDAQ